jgi:hypothetical protein
VLWMHETPRMRARAVVVALIGGALACGCGSARVGSPDYHSATVTQLRLVAGGGQSSAQRPTRLIQVISGATLKRFDLSEPAGVIRLLRITVPRGTRADVTGVIPHVAGVGISTPNSAVPSETCQLHGAVDVCTQAEQACPMPAATWHFQLHKLAGPAGDITFEFVVGQLASRRSG